MAMVNSFTIGSFLNTVLYHATGHCRWVTWNLNSSSWPPNNPSPLVTIEAAFLDIPNGWNFSSYST